MAVLQFILSTVFPLLLPRGLRTAHRPQRGLYQVGTFPDTGPLVQLLILATGWGPSYPCVLVTSTQVGGRVDVLCVSSTAEEALQSEGPLLNTL